MNGFKKFWIMKKEWVFINPFNPSECNIIGLSKDHDEFTREGCTRNACAEIYFLLLMGFEHIYVAKSPGNCKFPIVHIGSKWHQIDIRDARKLKEKE
jgi:hypothetical protein